MELTGIGEDTAKDSTDDYLLGTINPQREGTQSYPDLFISRHFCGFVMHLKTLKKIQAGTIHGKLE